jgi:hypothetical protein
MDEVVSHIFLDYNTRPDIVCVFSGESECQ